MSDNDDFKEVPRQLRGIDLAHKQVKRLSWEIMRLDMVDVFFVTADNTVMTGKARSRRHPPVGELGEADDKYVIGTAEILLFPP